MSEHLYKMLWDIDTEYGEFKKEEVERRGLGACDALLVFSLIDMSKHFIPERPGNMSIQEFSYDGRTHGGSLGGEDKMKAWAMLTAKMGEDMEVMGEKRMFLQKVFVEYMERFHPESGFRVGGPAPEREDDPDNIRN